MSFLPHQQFSIVLHKNESSPQYSSLATDYYYKKIPNASDVGFEVHFGRRFSLLNVDRKPANELPCIH
jgi:hypothetical protein